MKNEQPEPTLISRTPATASEPIVTVAPASTPTSAPTPEPNRRRKLRSYFWPGFVTGFLLLSLASCGGIVLATGINRINLSDLQNSGRAWTPPEVTATPVVAPAAVEDTLVGEPGGAFALGDRLINVTASQVNIRIEPGYLSKPAGDVIGQVPPGGTVEIIGGRTVADGLTWWLIRHTAPNGAVTDGWIAEATASGVQILGR